MSDETNERERAGTPWWSRPPEAGGGPAATQQQSPAASPAGYPRPAGFGDPPGYGPPSGVGRPYGLGGGGYGGFGAVPDTLGGSSGPPRSRTGLFVLLTVVVALVAGAVGAGTAVVVSRDSSPTVLDKNASLGAPPAAGESARPRQSVAGIAKRVSPSVVSIKASASSGGSGTGSGFVIRDDGYILTNNHVVEGAQADGGLKVVFSDETTATAKVVGADASYDLAVIKVSARDLPTAALGNSDDVVVGDPVVAIGSPLGLSGTVTSGIVSALDRPVTAGGSTGGSSSYISAIQTDAAINPGNSGGPLVNGKGEVIGVNSAIATLSSGLGGQSGSIGLGFAIPVNQARRVAEQLIRKGEATHPIIGATLDLRYTGQGARIIVDPPGGSEPVLPDGPAAKAGLRAGDVVTEFDGEPVDNAEELITAIRSHVPGDTVSMVYRRGSERHKVTLTLEAGQ